MQSAASRASRLVERIIKNMKCFFLAVILTLQVWATGLAGVKTVYVMPMANGLDQYVASRLTIEAVLVVVTDPQKADVVITDHVGQGFEESLADLYAGKADAVDKPGTEFARVGAHGIRGQGAAFLVDRKTHEVIWSTYERPKRVNPDEMKRAADRIVSRLARSIKGDAK